MVRGRFEVVTRHDEDAWLRRMHRAERVARRITGEAGGSSGIMADASVSSGIPSTEEPLAWLEGTSIQVGNTVTYRVEEGWLRGVDSYERLPSLRAQLDCRGTAFGIGRLPEIGREGDAQGALLLPEGTVLLVEHTMEVGHLPSVEAFADHALHVFEKACDGALAWVQR